MSPFGATRTYRSAESRWVSHSSTDTRKLATMMAIATISAKLDRTPLMAIDACPGAFARRASASEVVARAPRPARKWLAAVNSMAVQRGINAMPPISNSATAR